MKGFRHTVYNSQYFREQEDNGRRNGRYAKYERDTVRPEDGDEPPQDAHCVYAKVSDIISESKLSLSDSPISLDRAGKVVEGE